MNTIESLTCADPDELLTMLSPRHPLWADDPSAWIFRGQARKSWELLPKAYRPGADQYAEYAIECDLAGTTAWIAYEKAQNALLRRFAATLDHTGISRPAPQPKLFSGPAESFYAGEPLSEARPTMALMQHHGLPTPLLDWSRQGRFACSFAAAGAAKELTNGDSNDEPLVVWALRAAFLEGLNEYHLRSAQVDLRLLTAPAATNPNLHAQQGVFTWLCGDEEAHLKTVDSVMENALDDPTRCLDRWQDQASAHAPLGAGPTARAEAAPPAVLRRGQRLDDVPGSRRRCEEHAGTCVVGRAAEAAPAAVKITRERR